MSTHLDNKQPRISIPGLRKMKQAGERFACMTAYDASFARVVDRAGVHLILVGDSLGMVIQGHDSTLPVTMEDMVYHTRAVAEGVTHALLIADMPFMSYAYPEQAVHNAARLMQEGGAHGVKLEGAESQPDIVEALTKRGIPVCAHIGLQPQAVHKLGGYHVQGREEEVARRMEQDAVSLENAGADLLLIECVPRALTAAICNEVSIPVIGIGAGPDCDGQILVLYDILGVSTLKPRFAKDFMSGQDSIEAAVHAYVQAVVTGEFPGAEHCFD